MSGEPQRRRLVLKPRDEEAVKLREAERSASTKPASHICMPAPTVCFQIIGYPAQNPFGAAKPREAILAERSGLTEQEVLQAEVKKDKLNVRSTSRIVVITASRH